MQVHLAPRIVVDHAVCFGKPVIEGTRVPVELIVGQLAGGLTPEDVSREYDVTIDDVRAALAYAAEVLASDEVRGVS